MKPKQIWANLAVSDLRRTTQFYTDLGFILNGQSEKLTSFLFGEHNFVIHFFIKSELTSSIKGALTDSELGNEIMFTLSADSKEEVDQWAQKIERSEGKLVSQPEEFGEGYYGFVFTDPDGHKFNIFFM